MIESNKNEKQSNEELTKELIEYYKEKDPELAKILRDDIGLMQGDAIVVKKTVKLAKILNKKSKKTK